MKKIKSRYCIFCGFEIKPIESTHHEIPWQAMWNGGIIDRIVAGYGSNLDGSMYIIAICDNCIEKNKDKFEYIGDYMLGTNKYSQKAIKK